MESGDGPELYALNLYRALSLNIVSSDYLGFALNFPHPIMIVMVMTNGDNVRRLINREIEQIPIGSRVMARSKRVGYYSES